MNANYPNSETVQTSQVAGFSDHHVVSSPEYLIEEMDFGKAEGDGNVCMESNKRRLRGGDAGYESGGSKRRKH